MFDYDPRDRDDDPRDDLEVHWVKLGRGASDDDPRDVFEDPRERDDPRDRDPRDPFVHGLELPSGLEREVVVDGNDRYELNGDDSRSLATVGAFRVVPEADLRDPRREPDSREPDLRHLRDEGLVRFVSLEGRERAVTLTERGHHLLEAHRRDRAEERVQAFSAGVSRPRELSHDAQLYGAYLREEERLRDQGGEIQRVVLEQELKREYQEWLQERNRGRADSDGRPDRDEREIEEWAREHELPYFDESVHFPDFRIEHELEGRDAVRDAFLMPLTPREVEELEWYFRARQGEVGPPPDPDLDLPTAGRKFAAARYEALYREWQQRGIQALWAMRIDTLRDALQRGRGRIEFAPLSRQYLQLTPLIGTPAEIENCLEPGDNLGFV